MRTSLCRAELPLITQEPICRIVDGGVEVPRLEKWSLRKPGVPKPSVRIGGRYVVTGGSGALGSACVKWLLGQGAGHIVILSRSKPLFDLQAEPVLWLKCDVSIAAELKACAEEIRKGGEVCGIIHAAGVLADKLLAKQTEENIHKAFGPKVLAALLLPKFLDPKDFVVFFSSVAACLGSPGQVPYAAANGALDGYSNHAASNDNGLRTLSIQWGPWQHGMAQETKGALALAANRGLGAFSCNGGLLLLERLLSCNLGGAVCAICPMKPKSEHLEMPKTGEVLVLQGSAPQLVEVRQQVRTIVQKIAESEVDDNTPLGEVLGNSLNGVELGAALSHEFKLKLDATFYLQYPTIEKVVQHIVGNLHEDPWSELPTACCNSSHLTLFLVGGAMGRVETSFGDFAQHFPGAVFAAMPPRPSAGQKLTMQEILNALGPGLRRRAEQLETSQSLLVGGLSFGATVALALLYSEWAPGACGAVLLDPRNLPTYKLPSCRQPLWYEEICAEEPEYKFSVPCLHILAQVGDAYDHQMKATASQGFQSQEIVSLSLKKLFPMGVSQIPLQEDHFDFMLGSAVKKLAQTAAQAAVPLNPLTPTDFHRPHSRFSGCCEIATMSCRFPGTGTTFDEAAHERLGLFGGADAIAEIPFSRLDLNRLSGINSQESNCVYTKHGACMADVEWFDPEQFRIPAGEARTMDPQQRLLLEQASIPLRANRERHTGVWIGQANHDWLTFQRSGHVSAHAAAGASPSISASRINYVFDLQGPSVAIDTACSSSMVALCQAVDALLSEKCFKAVVGGTHVFADTSMFTLACRTTALSKLGRCLTFDSSADGYCRGEGVAALILQTKNEKDVAKSAICEVNGSATNHNGRSASLTAPNGVVQESLFRTTLASASVEHVDFVELHGTGTKLGDPVEAGAMMAVFKKSQNVNLSDNVITCGAVKSNVGHLEGSAGVAGLFKLISTLCQKAAPPNVHIRQLNPFLADVFFPNAGTVPASLFPDTLMSLDTTLGLHGAVSSFGFGGSNAQAILSPCNFNLTWEMAESKPNVFVPWRRPLSPLLTQREGTSIFDMRMLKFKHLFEDHAIGGQVFVETFKKMMSQHWCSFKGINLTSFALRSRFEMYIVVRVHSDLTIRTLVCSLAVVFSECITERFPFKSRRQLGVLIPYLVCKKCV